MTKPISFIKYVVNKQDRQPQLAMIHSYIFLFGEIHLQASDRELELDSVVSELLVHRGESLQLSLDINLSLRVQMNLEHLGSIHAYSSSLSNNLSGVYQILITANVNRNTYK
jgi:hypothetical protein